MVEVVAMVVSNSISISRCRSSSINRCSAKIRGSSSFSFQPHRDRGIFKGHDDA